MANQRLHAFEKTSIQARHSIKRLEMLMETTKDFHEKEVAKSILDMFENIRGLIPDEYQDVDLQEG